MQIRIAGLANDSIVDGPGLRLAVFTQGCPHHCPGCHNPESHDFNGGKVREVSEILEMIRENILLDGVTLSGGEPFAQPEACAEIARETHRLGLNVWCYTGYLFEQLLEGTEAWQELLQEIDVLVDGPFILSQKSMNLRFKGSSNQRLIDVRQSLTRHAIITIEQ